MQSPYFLKLEPFEGPLDLLLHLVKVSEIDIFNIDIVSLTSQYLDYLRLIDFSDLVQAGDFLAMASTLVEIKSRYLLPNEEKDQVDEKTGEDLVDDLQKRLLEYETFKKAGEFFTGLPQVGVDIATSGEHERLVEAFKDIEAPLTGNSATIGILYEQLLKTLPERKKLTIQAVTHLVTVEEKIDELKNLMEEVDFALFQGFYNRFASRYEFVVYILAVLEMVRWNQIKIYQTDILGPIWLYNVHKDEAILPIQIDSSASAPTEGPLPDSPSIMQVESKDGK